MPVTAMSEDEELRVWRDARKPDCLLCTAWFLGCLNGRETWAEEAVTPNFREEPDGRAHCDAFQWDPNRERLGRAVA